jgi:hypothetical protein
MKGYHIPDTRSSDGIGYGGKNVEKVGYRTNLLINVIFSRNFKNLPIFGPNLQICHKP